MKTFTCPVLSVLFSFLLVGGAVAQGDVGGVGSLSAEDSGRERLESLMDLIRQARKRPVDGVQGYGAEALRLLEAYPDPQAEIDVRLDLSWDASRGGDMVVGLEQARRAHGIASELKDAAAVARANYHIALARWYGGETEEAIEVARMALEAQRDLGEREAVATTLALLGAVYRSRSDYYEAIACHSEALEVAQETGNAAGVARSRNNIGLIYWNLGEHARARVFLEEVVEAYRAPGEEPGLASALSNLGLVLIELGEAEGALPLLEEAQLLQEGLGNDRGRAKTLSNIGFAQEELGLLDEALETLHSALALRGGLGDEWGLSRTLGSIAALLKTQGRLEESLGYYERAATAAEGADAREELSHILLGLAEVQELLGMHSAALVALRRHVEVVQGLDRAETARRISEFESEALLEAQALRVSQERFVRKAATVGAAVLLLLGAFGWNLFMLKRRAHRNLEVLHGRLSAHATELEEARGKIRSLEDLLPICSYCKSIRDEAGAWQQLEAYLHQRAGARLTHGICPDCFEDVTKSEFRN